MEILDVVDDRADNLQDRLAELGVLLSEEECAAIVAELPLKVDLRTYALGYVRGVASPQAA